MSVLWASGRKLGGLLGADRVRSVTNVGRPCTHKIFCHWQCLPTDTDVFLNLSFISQEQNSARFIFLHMQKSLINKCCLIMKGRERKKVEVGRRRHAIQRLVPGVKQGCKSH